jgi:hypothetical protein
VQTDEGVEEEFFEEIKTVRGYLSALTLNNHKIQTLKAKYAKAIKSAQERSTSDEMNAILLENGDLQKNIKEKMGSLKEKITLAEQGMPEEPETRMKRLLYQSISQEAAKALELTQASETDYK